MALPTLYDIRADYLEALETLTDPELDLPAEAVADTLEGLEGQLQEKATNVAAFMQHLKATAEAIKEAEAKMAKRRRAIENRAASLRDYLHDNMEAAGISRIESPWFELKIQNNPPAVAVEDEQSLPDRFKQEVTTIKVDRNAIKAALKAGEAVPGATLTAGTRLAIR
ncbi:siphovirus Gp157 family protein [Halomonas garicola]|uniref:siphovirus Gp157 family protein n=1 Tax=Halomonas garicola TaxID=1690008 RepID=UPI0028982B4D|nr:siphovirus Gp157 family protein [Halomonas garicola]